MKQVVIGLLAIFSITLHAELRHELMLIIKPLSETKDPVKKAPIRATYLARAFNSEHDQVLTINFKNPFAEPYHMVTEGAKLLMSGDLVRVSMDYPGLAEKIQEGKMNASELLISELYTSVENDHEKLEKLVALSKDKVILNCESSYLSLMATTGKNGFVNVYVLTKSDGRTVYSKDDLFTVDFIKAENTYVLNRTFGRIFIPMKNKSVEGLYFEKNLLFYSLIEPLSNSEKHPAERFIIDNDQVNSGLNCSTFKL